MKQIWRISIEVGTADGPEGILSGQKQAVHRLQDLESLLVTLVRARLAGLPECKKLIVCKNGVDVVEKPEAPKSPAELRKERRNKAQQQ